MTPVNTGDELLPLVDDKGMVIGREWRSVCHNRTMKLHPVVHVFILNSAGKLLLQKRPLSKLIQPGKWDISVGGHVAYGESVEIAVRREMDEEIGIVDIPLQLCHQYIWQSIIEREYVYIFIGIYNGIFKTLSDEIDDCRFWERSEIEANLGSGVFTPCLEHEYQLLNQMKLL